MSSRLPMARSRGASPPIVRLSICPTFQPQSLHEELQSIEPSQVLGSENNRPPSSVPLSGYVQAAMSNNISPVARQASGTSSDRPIIRKPVPVRDHSTYEHISNASGAGNTLPEDTTTGTAHAIAVDDSEAFASHDMVTCEEPENLEESSERMYNPWWLSKMVLYCFMVLVIMMAVALGVLFQVSQNQHGFMTHGLSHNYLWKYGPTAGKTTQSNFQRFFDVC